MEMYPRWVKTFLVIAALALNGCATTLSPEEAEWRHSIARENWAMCRMAYRKAHRPLFFDHHHSDDERINYIKGDLLRHSCSHVLGDYYINY